MERGSEANVLPRQDVIQRTARERRDAEIGRQYDRHMEERMKRRELDLGNVARDRQRSELLQRFDGLEAGDALVLISDRHPLPLVHWLAGQRFGGFRGAFLEQTPRWRVEITRR